MSVVFTGGGTFGSITSLLPIVKEMVETHKQTCFWIAPIGSPGKDLVESYGTTWAEINAGKLPRYISFDLVSLVPNILKGYKEAKNLLESFEARVVVSSGGFVSPPVLWQAKRLGIKTVVIQLDIAMGLANRLSYKKADKLFFSFPHTNKSIKYQEVVGPLIRTHMLDSTKLTQVKGLDEALPIIFVTGGGTGAEEINHLIWKLLPMLSKKTNIIHSTGEGKGDKTKKAKHYYQTAFLHPDDYYYWLSKADVVIGRAGMGFFSDAILYKKTVISIPMPKSHQEINSDYFASQNAIIQPEKRATADWLHATIDLLLKDEVKRKMLSYNIGSFAKEGTVKHIAEAIEILHN